MAILNLGSMNLDFVYHVDHIVQPGETLASSQMQTFIGGKGMNQSVALAKAGAKVFQAGMIGTDGNIFLETCKEYNIEYNLIQMIQTKSGHAIIQLDQSAQNCILLYGGANRMLTEEYVDEVLSHFGLSDYLLLQNEVNLIPYIIDKAWEKGIRIALNPSPYDASVEQADLGKISLFFLNEVEGAQMTGSSDPEEIISLLLQRYPNAGIVLTLGKDGAIYADSTQIIRQPVFPVKAIDTTAAGDTFTGYFLAGLTQGLEIPKILEMSAKAAAITVSRPGAVPSIPFRWEL